MLANELNNDIWKSNNKEKIEIPFIESSLINFSMNRDHKCLFTLSSTNSQTFHNIANCYMLIYLVFILQNNGS